MKRVTAICLAGCLLCAAGLGLSGALQAKCPDTVDGLTLLDLNGKPAKLSCASHKLLILNFWTTWCAPCRVEIPHLVEIYQEYKSLGVEIVGISLDTHNRLHIIARLFG